MNAVVLAVVFMLCLCLARVNVVIALTLSTLVAGLTSSLSFNETIALFNNGLGGGAKIALSYAMLGIFAVALSQSGVTNLISHKLIHHLGQASNLKAEQKIRALLFSVILFMAICSQNLIPIHIAFIPILIPPLLVTMSMINLDRRLVACLITFGLVATYMILPVGFGYIFLEDILLGQLTHHGLNVQTQDIIHSMLIPSLGMVVGLFIAVFFTYRKPRRYQIHQQNLEPLKTPTISKRKITSAVLATLVTVSIQIYYDDAMIIGALAGFLVLHFSGALRNTNNEDVIHSGVTMMAMIGFIMIAAAGFAQVIKATGDIDTLCQNLQLYIGDNKPLAAFIMLLAGLLITMGIGSSFSTMPIIAAIYIPLAAAFNFSIPATIALIGTASALGDAGSPASESTLGPTAGLNADGQHDHIQDTVIPTFIHFNIPLLIFGWGAALIL